MNKPVSKAKTEKISYDWQTAEVSLISHLPDNEDILNPLIAMQLNCKKEDIPHFFSYFFVKNIFSSGDQDSKTIIEKIGSFNNAI